MHRLVRVSVKEYPMLRNIHGRSTLEGLPEMSKNSKAYTTIEGLPEMSMNKPETSMSMNCQ